MARTIPDELRATFYDSHDCLDSKETKKPKFIVKKRQPVFSSPIIDMPLTPNHTTTFAQNISKQENVFVKIKRCIIKKKSHNN